MLTLCLGCFLPEWLCFIVIPVWGHYATSFLSKAHEILLLKVLKPLQYVLMQYMLGISFVACPEIAVSDSLRFTLDSCSFTIGQTTLSEEDTCQRYASGATVSSLALNLNLQDSMNTTVSNCTFQNSAGGSIVRTSSAVVVNSCNFTAFKVPTQPSFNVLLTVVKGLQLCR